MSGLASIAAMEILHLALASDWDDAVAAGRYAVSTRGATLEQVGFIHCSLPEQLPRVAAFVYADVTEPLVVLTMDRDELEAGGTVVIFEDGGDGEDFPHVYGAIDPAWVENVRPAHMVDGALVIEA